MQLLNLSNICTRCISWSSGMLCRFSQEWLAVFGCALLPLKFFQANPAGSDIFLATSALSVTRGTCDEFQDHSHEPKNEEDIVGGVYLMISLHLEDEKSMVLTYF